MGKWDWLYIAVLVGALLISYFGGFSMVVGALLLVVMGLGWKVKKLLEEADELKMLLSKSVAAERQIAAELREHQKNAQWHAGNASNCQAQLAKSEAELVALTAQIKERDELISSLSKGDGTDREGRT
ncbi:hypothetical protein [Phreatobacter sp.]|uniref:hypothetical protein n=1 Tax=Phreatobacter sp. TaxID=1966341 RepID=UPI003F6F4897